MNTPDRQLVELLVAMTAAETPGRRVAAVNDVTWRACHQGLTPEEVLCQGSDIARDFLLGLARISELSTNLPEFLMDYQTRETALGRRWAEIRSAAFVEVTK